MSWLSLIVGLPAIYSNSLAWLSSPYRGHLRSQSFGRRLFAITRRPFAERLRRLPAAIRTKAKRTNSIIPSINTAMPAANRAPEYRIITSRDLAFSLSSSTTEPIKSSVVILVFPSWVRAFTASVSSTDLTLNSLQRSDRSHRRGDYLRGSRWPLIYMSPVRTRSGSFLIATVNLVSSPAEASKNASPSSGFCPGRRSYMFSLNSTDAMGFSSSSA